MELMRGVRASNMRQYFERLEHNDYLPQGKLEQRS